MNSISISMFGEPYYPDRKPRKTDEGHWYFISDIYCPLCGHSVRTRTRMYSEKPEAWDDRHDFEEGYDYCDAL